MACKADYCQDGKNKPKSVCKKTEAHPFAAESGNLDGYYHCTTTKNRHDRALTARRPLVHGTLTGYNAFCASELLHETAAQR